jgi:hypothetical protein
MARRKIPVAAIEQLQRVLASASPCRVEEVTKVEAIRRLSVEIRGMQSKGYSWGAIAALLSDNGIAVTAVALKSYLKEVKTAGGKKDRTSRRRGGSIEAPPAVHAAPSPAAEGADREVASASPRADRSGPAGPEREASSGAAPAVAPTSSGAPRSGAEGAPRRSAFRPKEDSRDI